MGQAHWRRIRSGRQSNLAGQRNSKVGSMHDGNEIIGWGMASCNWEAIQYGWMPVLPFVRDGTVFASCGTGVIGTGTSAIVAQVLVI